MTWRAERRPDHGARGAPAETVRPRDVTAAWLLTADERGNPATEIDAGREDGRAWTDNNLVSVHVDGEAYVARLHELLSNLGPGDWLYLTDWRIDRGCWPGRAASWVRCWRTSHGEASRSRGCCGGRSRR
jgi:hypothetical protein